MFVQGCGNRLPHGVKNKINAFPPGKFGGGNEVGIPCNQDDLVCLLLVCQCRNIQANSHIHTFLCDVIGKVFIKQLIPGNFSVQELFLDVLLEHPAAMVSQFTQAERQFAPFAQFVKQSKPE